MATVLRNQAPILIRLREKMSLQFSTKISEIEAHSFFENGQFLTKICEIAAHSFFETG